MLHESLHRRQAFVVVRLESGRYDAPSSTTPTAMKSTMMLTTTSKTTKMRQATTTMRIRALVRILYNAPYPVSRYAVSCVLTGTNFFVQSHDADFDDQLSDRGAVRNDITSDLDVDLNDVASGDADDFYTFYSGSDLDNDLC